MPIRSRGAHARQIALAALSGLLFWGAYPPMDLWPLAFVSWVPLLLALRDASPRRAALLGAVQGFVTSAGALYFLPSLLQTFGAIPRALCVFIAILIHAYASGRMALVSLLFTRGRRNGWPESFTFALALAASEAFYPTLLPMLTAGQVHRIPLLIQLADIGGTTLVGVPIVLANTAFAELIAARIEARPPVHRKLLVPCAALALTLLYGVVRIEGEDARMALAESARIAVIQGNTPHLGVPLEQAIATYRDASTALAATTHVDLFVWPETALAKEFSAPTLRKAIRDAALPHVGAPPLPAPVITGALRREGRTVKNSAILFDPAAQTLGTYDKVHPLVMGEYVPLGDLFPAVYRWLPNAGHIQRGADEQAPLVFNEHRLETLICYEDLLSDYANDVAGRTSPDLLVNLTNDSWFGDSSAAAEHFALAQFRAVEHRRFLVRASNSGISGFVDSVGRAKQETPLLESAARVGEVRWLCGTTLFERLGDRPWLFVGAIVIAWSVLPRPRRAGPLSTARELLSRRPSL